MDSYLKECLVSCLVLSLEKIVGDMSSKIGRLARNSALGIGFLSCLACSNLFGGQSGSSGVSVNFFGNDGKPVEQVIEGNGVGGSVSSFRVNFGSGELAKNFKMVSSGSDAPQSGYVVFVPDVGDKVVLPHYVLDGGYSTSFELFRRDVGAGFDAKLTYEYEVDSNVYSAGVVSSGPVLSFKVPVKNGAGVGTGVGWVCDGANGCNYSLSFSSSEGALVDHTFMSLKKGEHVAFYPAEKFSKVLPSYGVLQVMSDGYTYPVALDQVGNSYNAVGVMPGGKGGVPGIRLVDLTRCETGVALKDLGSCPVVAGGEVSYRRLSNSDSFVYLVDESGIVSFVPKGSSGPVNLADGKYERVVNVPGYVVESRVVSMPDSGEIVPLVDSGKWSTKLAARQWNTHYMFPSTNFYYDTSRILKCYFNTTGMDFSVPVNNQIRDSFKQWVDYILPSQGIRTEYIESDNTPLPVWNWSEDYNSAELLQHVPDDTFVVYKSSRTKGPVALEGKLDVSNFTVTGVSVEWREGFTGFSINSEYPQIFGKEDQDVNDDELRSWGLYSAITQIKDSNIPGVYPTGYDYGDNLVKRVLPRGTQIVVGVVDKLVLPEKK
jgi:hypothetical protein